MSSGEADAYYNRNKWLIDGSGPKVAPKQEPVKDYYPTGLREKISKYMTDTVGIQNHIPCKIGHVTVAELVDGIVLILNEEKGSKVS